MPEAPATPIQLPDMAKHPVVMLYPTLEVVVAEPDMLSPERVVVPKPEAETERKVEVAKALVEEEMEKRVGE